MLLEVLRNPVTAVGLPVTLGLLSGSFTGKVVRGEWYTNLKFPPGRPPRQVFPIVWTTLYMSMGYASHLAVQALDSTSSPVMKSALETGLQLYYAQLGLNFLWSPLFFGAKNTGLALVDIILLTASTYYMTDRLALATNAATTPFLLPYCAWLSFATYLNAGIWWLN